MLVPNCLGTWRECPGNLEEVIQVPKDKQTMSFCVVKSPETGRFEVLMIPRNASRRTPESLHCVKKEFVGNY